MKPRVFTKVSFLALCTLVAQGCSSSSSTNGDINASNVNNVSSTFNALEGLLFDGSTTAKLNSHALAAANPVGRFSNLGCNYLNNRERMFQNVNRIRQPLCYIGHVESSDPAFTIGEEEYHYYKVMNAPGDKGKVQTGEFDIRLGKFKNASGKNCLRYQACKGGVSQSESFEVCDTDDGVTASIQNTFSDTRQNATISGKGSLAINAHADANGELASVEINEAHDETFGEGSGTFTGDKAKKENSFLGRFHNKWQDPNNTANIYENTMGVCAYAGAGTGSGKVEGTSGFPAFTPDGINYYCPPSDGTFGLPTAVSSNTICSVNYNQTESFSYNISTNPPSFLIVADADSAWFDQVSNCSVPSTITAPSDFSVSWDCTAPNGFTEIDMSTIDVTECNALDNHDDGWKDCDQFRRDFEAAHP